MRIELGEEWAPGINENPIPEGTVVAEIKVLVDGVHPRQVIDGFTVGIMRAAQDENEQPALKSAPKKAPAKRAAAVADE